MLASVRLPVERLVGESRANSVGSVGSVDSVSSTTSVNSVSSANSVSVVSLVCHGGGPSRGVRTDLALLCGSAKC